MSTAVINEEKILTINPFLGGSRVGDQNIAFDHCVLRDPRERDSLPENWTGFEVITARDGGKLITWSRMNFEQIAEAKRKFEELVAQGLVPYYMDPANPGQPTQIVMDEFDPSAAAAVFEKADFDPRNVYLAPTKLAVGG